MYVYITIYKKWMLRVRLYGQAKYCQKRKFVPLLIRFMVFMTQKKRSTHLLFRARVTEGTPSTSHMLLPTLYISAGMCNTHLKMCIFHGMHIAAK